MFRKKLIIFAAILIQLLSINAQAAWVNSTSFQIRAIKTYFNGSFEINPQNGPVNGCDVFAFHLGQGGNPLNTDGAKAGLSMALTAKAQNLSVVILYDNSSAAPCHSQQIFIE